MADAALALARRILAGEGGAKEAAAALRAAIAADDSIADDRRLWAALSYLHAQTGDTEGARVARTEINRLRTPSSKRTSLLPLSSSSSLHAPPSRRPRAARSLAYALEAAAVTEVARPPTFKILTAMPAPAPVPARKSPRLADATARLAKLREDSHVLFGPPQNALRFEFAPPRPDSRAPLMRKMRVLRARGRSIIAAVSAEAAMADTCASGSKFAAAAALSEDEGIDGDADQGGFHAADGTLGAEGAANRGAFMGDMGRWRGSDSSSCTSSSSSLSSGY